MGCAASTSVTGAVPLPNAVQRQERLAQKVGALNSPPLTESRGKVGHKKAPGILVRGSF